MNAPVVADTNVAVVADDDTPLTSDRCHAACVRRLAEITREGGLLLDDLGLIVHEYVRQLGFAGRPGAGRAFVKWAFDNQYTPPCCALVPICECRNPGWRRFESVPDDEELAQFDPSDQKFVAVAVSSGLSPSILNAVDSDWWLFRQVLARHGIHVDFLCPEQFCDG